MSCKGHEPELKYEARDDSPARTWVSDMLHTHGYGEAVIASRVEEAALSVLEEMKLRGLLSEGADAEALAHGLGRSAAIKVAFYWHDKKPHHEHEDKEEG